MRVMLRKGMFRLAMAAMGWLGLVWLGSRVVVRSVTDVRVSSVVFGQGSCVTVRLVGVRSVAPCHVVARLVLLSFGN